MLATLLDRALQYMRLPAAFARWEETRLVAACTISRKVSSIGANTVKFPNEPNLALVVFGVAGLSGPAFFSAKLDVCLVSACLIIV